jgi:hypothetical protein
MSTVADFLIRLFWITLAVAVVVIFSTESVGVRWVIASALLLLALLPIYCNWLIVILSFRKSGPRPSMVPLIGGVLAAIGIARLPLENCNRWWWLALIADPTVVTLVAAIPLIVRDTLRRGRSNPGQTSLPPLHLCPSAALPLLPTAG